MSWARNGTGWIDSWFKAHAPAALKSHIRSGSSNAGPAAAISGDSRSSKSPRLATEPPPFAKPPDGQLVPARSISGDSNEVDVTAGFYHLFVYLPWDSIDAPAVTAACEVDFFAQGSSPSQRGVRRAHYTLALPSAHSDGDYHAFRIIAPKDAVTAVARFADTSRSCHSPASCCMFLVPTSTLTYADTDTANNRYFCPIPVGRLHCYFETGTRRLCRLVPDFTLAFSPADDPSIESKIVYQPMWGTAADAQAKAEKAPVQSAIVPLVQGAATYDFRPTASRALIDVDFVGPPAGAVLRGPLKVLPVGPDFPSQYLALSDDFFEQKYKVWRAAFSRLKFPEAPLTGDMSIDSPTIIAITGQFLAIHFAALAGFTPVTDQDAMAVLNDQKIDAGGIILVESLFHQRGQSWKSDGTTPITDDPRLQELLRIAALRGWTRVFWFSEESMHLNAFVSQIGQFDRIVSETVIDDEHRVGFIEEITASPPFVDPRRANPLLGLGPNEPLVRFVDNARRSTEGKTLVVGWADLLEGHGFDEVLDEAALVNVHICEDQWKFRASKLDDLPRLAPNVIGSLPHAELISAYKRYGAAIFFYPSLRSDVQLMRNVMLAASCNCLPIIYCVGQHPKAHFPIDELAIICSDPDRLRRMISLIATNDLELLRQRHLVWRMAATRNFACRSMARMLGLKDPGLPTKIEDVPVSIITPSKRPDSLRHAYRQICAQDHKSWEWIIVLNKRDIPLTQLPEEITSDNRVKILSAAPSKNIGFCLELGIAAASGTIWVKLDDDDFYGPGYLSDTVILSGMSEAELLGRPPAYLYSERLDALFRRPYAGLAFLHAPGNARSAGLVSGASLAGRVNSARPVTFGFDWRSSVDSNYIEAMTASGGAVCSGPNLGLVAFRAADPAVHTWQTPESMILANTEQVGSRNELELVLV